MKDRIKRAKKFVDENRGLICWNAGLIVGTGITIAVFTNMPQMEICQATREQLQTLLDDPTMGIEWTEKPLTILLTVDNPAT